MCNETIQPPETNGTIFLLGGRVCQGPRYPRMGESMIGGSEGPPPNFFLKSMSLRMHLKPF